MPPKRKSSAVSSSASALAGLTFCMTGTMSVSRSEMEGFIQANGGDVAKTVTNKCTHLMSSESGTKKCADAEKKGALVVDEAWVREQCGGSERQDEAPPPAAKKATKAKAAPKKAKAAPKKAKAAPPPSVSTEGALAGLTFCMTGTMSVSRSEMEGFIQANGGDVAKTVTNKCTHLMSSESGTKKCADAEKKGALVVDEAWVREQCGGSDAMDEDDDDDEEKEEEEEEGEQETLLKQVPAKEEEEEEELFDNVYIYFRNHPLSQYCSSASDSSCFFQSQKDGTMKFWKVSFKPEVGKVFGVHQRGTVGTEEGKTEWTEEYQQMGAAMRHFRELRTEEEEKDEEDYSTFQAIYDAKKELQRMKAKKAKMGNFPTNLTSRIVCDYNDMSSCKPMWVTFLQKFLPSYGYLGDSYILDYSNKDMTKWKWYNAYDDEDDDDYMKKGHTALVKKDKFVKQCSKESRHKNKLFNDDTNIAFDFVIFELSIDGTKFYLLSIGMCVNDPLGQYNVLFDSKKKEIIRIDVQDGDENLEEGAEWSSPAMKKQYGSFIQRIEPLIVSQDILNGRSTNVAQDDEDGDDDDDDDDDDGDED